MQWSIRELSSRARPRILGEIPPHVVKLRHLLLSLLVLAILGAGFLYFLRTRPIPVTGPSAEEVLRLAAQKSREIQSAVFGVDGNFQIAGGTLPSAGTFQMNGVLNGAGSTIQFTASVDALVTPGFNRGQTFRVRSAVSAVVLGQKELYFKMDTLETEPDQSLFQPELLTLLLGRWWVLPPPPSAGGVEVPGGATPSPAVLQAQAQVVRVVKDFGTEALDGQPARHIEVALAPEKLLTYLEEIAASRQEAFDRTAVAQSIADFSATGEMWIDAQQFTLRRVRWDIAKFRMEESDLSGTFNITLSAFNSAPAITVPTDARPLSPATLFSSPLSPEKLDALRSLVEGESPSL